MSCLDHQLWRLKLKTVQVAREEPAQDLSGEIPLSSADETLTIPEIPLVPSGATPPSSTSIRMSPEPLEVVV